MDKIEARKLRVFFIAKNHGDLNLIPAKGWASQVAIFILSREEVNCFEIID